MEGVTASWGVVLKGCGTRKVESHWCRENVSAFCWTLFGIQNDCKNYSLKSPLYLWLRSYPQLIAAGRGEPIFFKNVAPGKLTTLRWRTTYPRIFGQHKLDLMCVGVGGRQNWLGREVGSGCGRSWGRVNMNKTHCKIFSAFSKRKARQKKQSPLGVTRVFSSRFSLSDLLSAHPSHTRRKCFAFFPSTSCKKSFSEKELVELEVLGSTPQHSISQARAYNSRTLCVKEGRSEVHGHSQLPSALQSTDDVISK